MEQNQDSGASAEADQALAVPVEPVCAVSPLTGFDPSRDELESLREWKYGASLTLCELRERLGQTRSALKNARGWLHMLSQQRPATSDIHRVLAEVEAALAQPTGDLG